MIFHFKERIKEMKYRIKKLQEMIDADNEESEKDKIVTFIYGRTRIEKILFERRLVVTKKIKYEKYKHHVLKKISYLEHDDTEIISIIYKLSTSGYLKNKKIIDKHNLLKTDEQD